MADVRSARPLTQEEARAVVIGACRVGDESLDSRIDDLWAAKADPEQMRRLLARHRLEVDAARSLLAAAAAPQWWSAVTAERLEEACRAARVWSEGDPISAELERCFASRLRSVFGIDLAGVPRHRRAA